MASFRIFAALKKQKDNILFIGCVVFSFFLLTFTHSDSRNGVERFGFSVISTLQKGVYVVIDFFSETVNSISELKQLKAEYSDLKEMYEQQHRFLNTVEGLQIENELLKEQMYISNRLTYEHITTDVIAKDPGNFLSYVKIGCGTKQNIDKYMPVIAYQKGRYGLVGSIVDAGYSASEVMPLFSANFSVAARLQSSRYEGLVSGLGYTSDFILMKYIPQEAVDEIKIGDLVVTSGMRSIYPYGIPIGYVDRIVSGKGEISVSLYLKPVIEFSRLEYVQVLKAQNPEM